MIDYILQYRNEIIPIEVKASENINNNSLKVYNEKYNPKLRIRFSLRNLKKDDNLINIPLFMVEYIKKFMNIWYSNLVYISNLKKFLQTNN